MSKRYPGGIISATTPVVNLVTASGFWSIHNQLQEQQSVTWPSDKVDIDWLAVAGGGGGGYNNGGGGGAGGMLFSSTPLKVQKSFIYSVIVGAGGVGSLGTTRSANGSNSLILGSSPGPSITPTNFAGFFTGSTSLSAAKYYLSTPADARYSMGSGSFSIEGWMYPTGGGSGSSTGTWRTLVSTRPSNVTTATTNFSCGIGPEGGVYFYSNGMTVYINTSLNLLNKWSHFAFVKNGTAFTVYINGVSVGTGTNSDNLTANIMSIGANLDGSETFEGFLSNIRITKGVAVYTGAFTTPSIPLSATQSSGTNISAITTGQCSLLTLKSSTVIDTSSYNATITNNGAIRMVPYTDGSGYVVFNAIGGGGGGGGNPYFPAQDGGSGGGGGNGGPNGAGRAGQGNNGGAATLVTGQPYSAAGGGGAGAAATNAPNNATATPGGIGLQNSITGTATYYAGGGSGCGSLTSVSGGGGAGSPASSGNGSSGTANTGGGGGGGAYGASGGTGGSGIVIIRCLEGLVATTTGSPTITVSGGFRIYKFTTSGSITF